MDKLHLPGHFHVLSRCERAGGKMMDVAIEASRLPMMAAFRASLVEFVKVLAVHVAEHRK
jgi:hypothetical protein